MIRTQEIYEWTCATCGFRNKGSNKVCGGMGQLGCKRSRKGGQLPSVVFHASNGGGSENGSWVCSCGFQNKAKNRICGGIGNLGCNSSRPKHSPTAYKNEVLSDGRWRCAKCNFNNAEQNDVCGGHGKLGCKRPRLDNNPLLVSPSVAEVGINIGDLFPPLETTPSKKVESKDLTPWVCACGFKNKAQNTRCGGRGPLGCKSPRPEQWTCICGFRNRGDNEKCGGNGPMGCDRSKPVSPLQQMIYSPNAYGPYSPNNGLSSIYSTPIQQEKWTCLECNFKNKASNQVCGGQGELGCNAQRPVCPIVPTVVYRTVAVPTTPQRGVWVCDGCGFRNKEENSICGGRGELGCKKERPMQGAYVTAVYQDQSFWNCKACNFRNRAQNDFCGGSGRLGCGAAGPKGWRCPTCGFKNRQDNKICGGNGELGCDAPLPDVKNRKRKLEGDDDNTANSKRPKISEHDVDLTGVQR